MEAKHLKKMRNFYKKYVIELTQVPKPPEKYERRRVQAVAGQVFTSEEFLAQLMEWDAAKAAKAAKKRGGGGGRGRGRGAETQ